MRKIFDDLTGEEVKDEDLCEIKILHRGKGMPMMKPLEVSSITADKVRKWLQEQGR